MPTLLRIDASARTEGSNSRAIGDAFEAAWHQRHTNGRIVRRDLAKNVVPQIKADTIQGFFTPPANTTEPLRAATSLSDTLIAELKGADELLITAPMYNFTIPSSLKAWVDQIVRIGHTFNYDGATFTGLVTGKPVTFALAYGAGGYDAAGPLATLNFVQPYLQTLFGFLGFTDIRFAGVEGTTGDAGILAAELSAAKLKIAKLAA